MTSVKQKNFKKVPVKMMAEWDRFLIRRAHPNPGRAVAVARRRREESAADDGCDLGGNNLLDCDAYAIMLGDSEASRQIAIHLKSPSHARRDWIEAAYRYIDAMNLSTLPVEIAGRNAVAKRYSDLCIGLAHATSAADAIQRSPVDRLPRVPVVFMLLAHADILPLDHRQMLQPPERA